MVESLHKILHVQTKHFQIIEDMSCKEILDKMIAKELSTKHSNKVCSSQEFQCLCIPHVQAWERLNTCVQACMPLGYKHFQAFPKGVQAWTQAFISQALPSLYMGNAQALKLFGNYKL